MIMTDDDIDIERAAHDPDYRRQVIAQLNREPVKSVAGAKPAETAKKIEAD